MGAGYQDLDLVFARPDGSMWPPVQFSSDFRRMIRRRASTSVSTTFDTPTRVSSSRQGCRSRWSLSAWATRLPRSHLTSIATFFPVCRLRPWPRSTPLSPRPWANSPVSRRRSVVNTAPDDIRPEGATHDQGLQVHPRRRSAPATGQGHLRDVVGDFVAQGTESMLVAIEGMKPATLRAGLRRALKATKT